MVWSLAAAGVLLGTYFYPVGGEIWTTRQVMGVAMVRGERRVELAEQTRLDVAVGEALTAARIDRFRRFNPGARCSPADLELQTSKDWVRVRLRCTAGLLFDYIPREAWQ